MKNRAPQTRKMKFCAHQDKDDVSAILEIPAAADALLVLGHGAGAGMLHQNMEHLARAFHAERIATFRYQFPFMERGGGRDSKEVSLSTVANATAQAAQLVPEIPVFAGGHSFGGRMTSMAAAESRLEGIQGLVFFAFPLHPAGKPSIERAEHLQEISEPMLFLSGTRDKLLTPELFAPVLESLGANAQFHWLATADHGYKTLKRQRDPADDVFEEMARVSRAWIDQI